MRCSRLHQRLDKFRAPCRLLFDLLAQHGSKEQLRAYFEMRREFADVRKRQVAFAAQSNRAQIATAKF